MIPDSHAHLDMLGEPVSDVMAAALAAGVSPVITIGIDLKSSERAAVMASTHDQLYASVGIHPNDTGGNDTGAYDNLLAIASNSAKVVGIGETGLDYYRDSSPRDVQKAAFREHIRVARETGKTLIIHDREAHEDVLRILIEEDTGRANVVLHCFSGDVGIMLECIRRGYYVSFAGPLTFKNAGAARDAAGRAPLDRLLVETDAPFLTPEPFRGKPNSPARVRLVAEKLAEIKGVSIGEMASVLTENTMKAFKLTPGER